MESPKNQPIAVVLAAGLSRRMGQAKLLMPWVDGKSVLEQTLSHLLEVIQPAQALLISGGYRDAVEAIAGNMGIRSIYNEAYATGEMLSSLKVAVETLVKEKSGVRGMLVLLGDVPLLQPSTIATVLRLADERPEMNLIAPVFEGKQGHPVFIRSTLFDSLLNLPPSGAPRDLFKANSKAVLRVGVDDPGSVIDIDTPALYARYRPPTSSYF
ncbi:MAG: nucleotidyltransferase family protein [Chloroflexota bacterium]